MAVGRHAESRTAGWERNHRRQVAVSDSAGVSSCAVSPRRLVTRFEVRVDDDRGCNLAYLAADDVGRPCGTYPGSAVSASMASGTSPPWRFFDKEPNAVSMMCAALSR